MNQDSREDPEAKEDLDRKPGDEKAEATTLHRTSAQEEETCARGADRDGGAPPACTRGRIDRESPDEDREIAGERSLHQRAKAARPKVGISLIQSE
jgi:hypothetical protein